MTNVQLAQAALVSHFQRQALYNAGRATSLKADRAWASQRDLVWLENKIVLCEAKAAYYRGRARDFRQMSVYQFAPFFRLAQRYL